MSLTDLTNPIRIETTPEQDALLTKMDTFEEKFPSETYKYSFYFRNETDKMQVVVAFENIDQVGLITSSPDFKDFEGTFVVEVTNFNSVKDRAQKSGEKAVSILYGVPLSTLFQSYTPIIQHIIAKILARGFNDLGTEARLLKIAHETAHNTYIQPRDFYGNIINETCYSGLKVTHLLALDASDEVRAQCISDVLSGNWDAVPWKAEDNEETKQKLRIDLSIYMALQEEEKEEKVEQIPPKPPTRAEKIRAILAGGNA